ncbi:MAG: ABC transporter permease [Spirochaetales bacterium]|jgi:peptide/nickel transport system permease protein|nr:ABC transporter permease [Spirochaetales bacterium]MBQ5391136.1 ABC transporter permease [Spirochaetales bacterium]MBQ7281671.1 ABC transporter permease [Spirochaetales bacterium]
MLRYAIKRLLLMIPVIIGVSFLIFFIMDLAPGNIIDTKIAEENMTEEETELLREQYNLNGSMISRYFKYMGGLVRGDLGKSYITGKPVLESYLEKMPATIVLAAASILVSIIISIPLGIYSAIKRGTFTDNTCMVLSFLGLSIPNFWLGLMLIITIALNVKWIPTSGFRGLASVILPAITVGTGLTATLARTTRSSMLDVLNQDYLRTERAKGNSEFRVVMRFALVNALIPIITIAGGQFAACLGGSVLTETIFAWPGVGKLIIDSVNSRDVPMVVGCIIMKSFSIGLVVLGVDLLYAVIDPRIKAMYARGRRRSR